MIKKEYQMFWCSLIMHPPFDIISCIVTERYLSNYNIIHQTSHLTDESMSLPWDLQILQFL